MNFLLIPPLKDAHTWRGGALRNINMIPWSFPKVTCDTRCAPKRIVWRQTPTNCFTTGLDKYIVIIYIVQKRL